MSEAVTMTLGKIVENNNVAPGHFLMSVRLPLDFPDPRPGQFVMIRSAGHREPLLGRPLSVYGFRRREDHSILDLLYRIAGGGTELLARLRAEDPLSVLGPLGTGFSAPAGMKRALFIAGGVGVAPLTYLLERGIGTDSLWTGGNCTFYIGAKSDRLLLGLDRLKAGGKLRICTDDGSLGAGCTVTALLEEDLDGYDPADTALFACGPGAMIRSLVSLLEKSAFTCQVSLEERMACGLGACLGCAVAVRGDEGTIGYQRVCKEGPVFDLRRIVAVS
ncbi:MAG: dihydroorotate dehydrogenase electron transfer subunit [Deltaproteobacteria bacterium]|nr:dihydroorotate dehydrogenase electron transfer subunit [Deltaproteobacteria bacterium]